MSKEANDLEKENEEVIDSSNDFVAKSWRELRLWEIIKALKSTWDCKVEWSTERTGFVDKWKRLSWKETSKMNNTRTKTKYNYIT